MRELTKEEKNRLLNLNIDDITFDLLLSFFADTVVEKGGKKTIKKSQFNPNDTFILEKGEYFNTGTIKTTIGRFLYNKIIVEENFREILGYINTAITNSVQEKIEEKLASALKNDNITVDQMIKYLDKIQWLSAGFNSVISNSLSPESMKVHPKVAQRKKELLKEHAKELEAGDVITAVKIENELVDLAKKELSGNLGMELYDSGARGKFGNNYKNIAIMQGPVFNPVTGKFDIVTSNFMEGIEKKDITPTANSVILAAEPKAVGTQVAGYLTKKINAVYQSVVIDETKKDCGTKRALKITLRPFMRKSVLYSYIVDDSKLILLDEAAFDKYVNKTVYLRNPMFCIGENICPTCAGKNYEMIGINTIGLSGTKVSSKILNLNLKKVHDATAKIYPIDLNLISL